MNNMFGIGSWGSNFYDSYFGTSGSSNSTSWFSGLGDMRMIQSGVYKKALKAYYAINKTESSSDNDKESISESGKADSNEKLSLVKAASGKLNEAASAIMKKDFDKVKAEDVVDDVKNLVSSYNSTLSSTKDLNSYGILQTAVWTTQQVKASSPLLDKIGITVNADNTLSLDEDKFKKADKSVLNTLFSGSFSLASKLSQKASTLTNQSTNQIAVNSGKTLYTKNGTFN